VYWCSGRDQLLVYSCGGLFTSARPLSLPCHLFANGDNNQQTTTAQVLATFQEEVSSWGAQEGVMVGMPAVVTAGYGKGVVLCMSPHPESTPEPPSLNHSRGKPRFRRLVQRAVLHVCRIPHPAETAAAEAEAAAAARR
jgi:hypothetical protein